MVKHLADLLSFEQFCGDTIAGISLLTSSVMRLRLEEERDIYCDIFLPQFSLYVMK